MIECKMKDQFYLAHVVLYAKRWYKWSDNIYDDLCKMLELDGYSGYNKNEREGIARKLKYAYDKWCEFLDTCPEYHFNHGKDFIESMMFNNYRYNEKYPKYNFNDFCDIVIITVLLEFSNADIKYMNIPCPAYDENNLPNDKGLFGNFSHWYKEAEELGITENKDLAKFFNEKVQEEWKKLNND